jgi:hypothetical protein
MIYIFKIECEKQSFPTYIEALDVEQAYEMAYAEFPDSDINLIGTKDEI